MTSTDSDPIDPSKGYDYPDINSKDIAFVEIFPPVGIARAGNSGTSRGVRDDSDIDYFYTPEVPHQTASVADDKFRDDLGRIKRQVMLSLVLRH